MRVVPAYFFTDQSTEHIVFIIAIYTGYVSGAVSEPFKNVASFVGFSLGIPMPFAWRMFYQGDELYTAIGLLIVFYGSMLTYIARTGQFSIEENHRFISNSKKHI